MEESERLPKVRAPYSACHAKGGSSGPVATRFSRWLLLPLIDLASHAMVTVVGNEAARWTCSGMTPTAWTTAPCSRAAVRIAASATPTRVPTSNGSRPSVAQTKWQYNSVYDIAPLAAPSLLRPVNRSFDRVRVQPRRGF